MTSIGIIIVLIILASAVHKYVNRRTGDSVPGDAEQRLADRMDRLDRRLTDIQDVMIAIDEKMSRPGVTF